MQEPGRVPGHEGDPVAFAHPQLPPDGRGGIDRGDEVRVGLFLVLPDQERLVGVTRCRGVEEVADVELFEIHHDLQCLIE